MATTEGSARTPPTTAPSARNPLYSALIGLAAVVVLLQGLWAGLFIHEGEDYQKNWVSWHSRGAEVAIGLAVLATVVAVVRLRSRTDLVVGSILLVVLLVLESYLGGLIGNHTELTAVHIPLAMALMALVVWLPLRATRR